jgi:hypothetical protein
MNNAVFTQPVRLNFVRVKHAYLAFRTAIADFRVMTLCDKWSYSPLASSTAES